MHIYHIRYEKQPRRAEPAVYVVYEKNGKGVYLSGVPRYFKITLEEWMSQGGE